MNIIKPKNINSTIKKFNNSSNPSEELLNKIKNILDYCSECYYNDNSDSKIESPLLDDEWSNLFERYNDFKNNSLSTIAPKEKRNKNMIDTEHNFPELVGTLFKSNYVYKKDIPNDSNNKSVEDWFKRYYDLLPNDDFNIFITDKEDGNSITLTYNDKRKVISALTRGKNGEGSDKLSYFKDRTLPKCIPIEKGDLVGIKFEAIVNDKLFEELCSDMNYNYANTRSLVAGILGADNGINFSHKIILVPIRISYKNKRITRAEELELIRTIHFNNFEEFPINIHPTVDDKFNYVKIKNNITFNRKLIKVNKKIFLPTIQKIYDSYIKNIRKMYDYPIDGLVIELVDDKLRKKFGRDDFQNNFELALKFPSDTKRSKVIDIEFYVSKNGTGRVTPVVVFEPVYFSGAKCDHVSIANYKRFKELNLHKGEEVLITYRNDVLSYLNKSPLAQVTNDMPRIKFTSRCPICNSKLVVNSNKTYVFCKNKECQASKVGVINNWFIKLNIKGVKENTIKDLIINGLITDIPSLYSLKKSDIMKLDGYLEKSASNIIEAINSKKQIYDYELIGSLNISNIALDTAKLILTHYTINSVFKAKNMDFFIRKLIKIKGIEEITAKNYVFGILENKDIISKLLKILDIKEYSKELSTNDNPESIVFTGFRDKVMQEQLELKGHFIRGNVSSKTTMLIVKRGESISKKEEEAIKLNIPVYSIEEFKKEIYPNLIK